MADTILFANNAVSTLSAGITAVATSIFLQTGDGALFPSPGAGQEFRATLADASGNIEIVKCTSRSTDTLTVVRAQEGTTGYAFLAGDKIELRLTKESVERLAQKDGSAADLVAADSVMWDGANKTVSTSTPSGGVDGDIWLEREA